METDRRDDETNMNQGCVIKELAESDPYKNGVRDE